MSILAERFEQSHRLAEREYNDDGSWGNGYTGEHRVVTEEYPEGHPLVRTNARNALGYIGAYKITGNETYRHRVEDALSWLITKQCPNGNWMWYHYPDNHCNWTNHFETGLSVAALVEGYKAFNYPEYLNTAQEGGNFLKAVPPIPDNPNFDFQAVYGLSLLYEITQDIKYLDKAIDYAISAIEEGGQTQLPEGRWSQRDEHIVYHSICTRGLVVLLSVMPKLYTNYAKIKLATERALNHLNKRQTVKGLWRNHYYSDDSDARWFPAAAQAIVYAEKRLGWPLQEAYGLAVKGLSATTSGGLLMGIGSLMSLEAKTEPQPEPVVDETAVQIRKALDIMGNGFELKYGRRPTPDEERGWLWYMAVKRAGALDPALRRPWDELPYSMLPDKFPDYIPHGFLNRRTGKWEPCPDKPPIDLWQGT